MTVAVPQTDADRFLGAIGPSSIHEVKWLRLQEWVLKKAVNKNKNDIQNRVAHGVALALLGERELALDEANTAFSHRHGAPIIAIDNLSNLSMHLGLHERACDLAKHIISTPEFSLDPSVRRTVHGICTASGNLNLWKSVIQEEINRGIKDEDCIFNLLNEYDALDAYAGHQRIMLAVIGDRLCSMEIDLSYEDGGPLIGQRYYIVATNAERKALYRQLFEAKDAFFHKDGKPWSPLGGIVGAVLCSLPLEEDEAVA